MRLLGEKMNKIFMLFSGLIFFSSLFSYFLMDWNIQYSQGFLLNRNGQEISSIQAVICLFGGESILPIVFSVTGLTFFFSYLISRNNSNNQSSQIEISKNNVFPNVFKCPECNFKNIINENEKNNFEIKCKECGAIIKQYELRK
jgi:ribosomal protein S27E